MVDTIDLDDPAFAETTDYDPNQDQSVRIVPPELDLAKNSIQYDIKLSIGANKSGEKAPYPGSTGRGTKYLGLVVKAQVLAPGKPYDKAFVNYPFGTISTLVFNNTTSAADLSRVLGKPMPVKLSQTEQMGYAMNLLKNEPVVQGRLEWGTYCTKCEKEIPQLTGESNWPEKKLNGDYIGHEQTSACPDCKSEVNASARIKKLVVVKS